MGRENFWNYVHYFAKLVFPRILEHWLRPPLSDMENTLLEIKNRLPAAEFP